MTDMLDLVIEGSKLPVRMTGTNKYRKHLHSIYLTNEAIKNLEIDVITLFQILPKF